jgi:hypothetical protein
MASLPIAARWAVTATFTNGTKGVNMSIDTNLFDSKLQPRRAALFDCTNEIFLKLDEWEEKIDLREPFKGEERKTLLAAVHALEKLHRQANGPDSTRWFASWAIANS